jgi:hypothetical protein
MSSFEDEMTYFENMSRAFATKAHTIASVLHRNIEEPPLSTIWGRIELPTLQAGGMVDWVSLSEFPLPHIWSIRWDYVLKAGASEHSGFLEGIRHQGLNTNPDGPRGSSSRRRVHLGAPFNRSPVHSLHLGLFHICSN